MYYQIIDFVSDYCERKRRHQCGPKGPDPPLLKRWSSSFGGTRFNIVQQPHFDKAVIVPQECDVTNGRLVTTFLMLLFRLSAISSKRVSKDRRGSWNQTRWTCQKAGHLCWTCQTILLASRTTSIANWYVQYCLVSLNELIFNVSVSQPFMVRGSLT